MDTAANCSTGNLHHINKQISWKVWQSNGLGTLNAMLIGIVVIIGSYAPRYRHHPLIRFLFLGATTLFLPIVTAAIGAVANLATMGAKFGTEVIAAQCLALYHITLVLLWTGLVITIAVNTSTAVAGDPREKQNIFFPLELFLKAIWIAYITVSTISSDKFHPVPQVDLIFIPLYVLTFSKLGLRCSAFVIARRSCALGRNPKLIAGYMDQLATRVEPTDQHMRAPGLVVKGEDTVIVLKHPHGYQFESTPVSEDRSGSKKLVTLDSVWDLNMPDEQKDLCFSFSLFKLLRCQFARYKVFKPRLREVVQMFFRKNYFKEDNTYERLFQVVADELSFIEDYYNSFLPISYSHQLFPAMNIILSFLSICYCSYLLVFVSRATGYLQEKGLIYCILWCGVGRGPLKMYRSVNISGAYAYFDVVPAYSVIAVLMLSEMRDIVVYLCSNWTKVAFISNYTKDPTSWKKSLAGFVFKCCRCRLTNKRVGTLNQCSLPVGPQNKKDQCSMFVPMAQLLGLPNRKKIVLTDKVKASIFKALKAQLDEQEGVLEHIGRPSIEGFDIWINDDDAKHIADIVLAWHIATNIFEASNQDPAHSSATELSCYCAYLVDCHPELLPGEDDEWCKSPFKAVKKHGEPERKSLFNAVEKFAERIIPGQSESKLVQKEYSMNIKEKGEKIAAELATKTNGWEVLERFWSNMILYLATSENLDGHAAAIARGGELITLLWALLAHLGIVGSRLDGADDPTSVDRAC